MTFPSDVRPRAYSFAMLSSVPEAIFNGARTASKDSFARSQCAMRKHESTSPYRTTRKPRVRTSGYADCTYTKTPACSYPPPYREPRILWSRTCLVTATEQWKQNAEPLQSQFLRHANFKHVDRFCSLKQLKLDEALRRRGAAKQETHMHVCRASGCGVHLEGWGGSGGQGQRGRKEASRETTSRRRRRQQTHGTIIVGQLLLLLRHTRLTAIADPCAGA